MLSAMTSYGRSGDKGDYGKRKDQRNLFQGYRRGTELNRTEDGADGRSQYERLSSLDKGKQKTNNIIGCQPYTKHRFQQNRSGVFVCVLDIVTRSAPARFHRSVHGVSAGFIPRRRATHSTAGAACQGQSRRCAAVLRTLDWQSRLCYLPRRDGGYILQSRPLSLDRERAGG